MLSSVWHYWAMNIPSAVFVFLLWSALDLMSRKLVTSCKQDHKEAKRTLGPSRTTSKRESRQSAILFILSTAAAILTQTNRMKFPLCRYILLWNWIEIVLLFVCVTSFQHCTRWRHVTFFYWRRWRVRSRCVQWKSKCGLYLVSWDVPYFCHANKCHIYATPLRSKYFVWLHYKIKIRCPDYRQPRTGVWQIN